MPEIHVLANVGRTIEEKRALVADITDAAVKHLRAPLEAVDA